MANTGIMTKSLPHTFFQRLSRDVSTIGLLVFSDVVFTCAVLRVAKRVLQQVCIPSLILTSLKKI
jgi:hypothetical protein